MPALMIDWDTVNVEETKKVLSGEYGAISDKTKSLTSNFISIIKDHAGDLRHEYNRVVLYILSKPAELIYFIRELTKARIMLSYKIVPEFEHVVSFYSTLVRRCRSELLK